MSILYFFGSIALVAVLAFLLVTYVPMSPMLKRIVTGAAVVICLLICLYAFGVWDAIRGMKVPRI